MSIISTLTLGAVKASKTLAVLEESIKNQVLLAMALALREKKQNILTANQQDLTQATQNSLSSSMLDRLTLNDERIEAMASGCEAITTNLGALYETCSPFGTFVNFDRNFDNLEKKYKKVLISSIENYWSDKNQDKLKLQVKTINSTYSCCDVLKMWKLKS